MSPSLHAKAIVATLVVFEVTLLTLLFPLQAGEVPWFRLGVLVVCFFLGVTLVTMKTGEPR